MFSLSTHLILSLAALAVMGAADVVSVVIRFALVQLRTPPEMRGRVSAVNGMFTGTSNYLGEFRAGAVAAAIGAVPAVLIGGDRRVRGRRALDVPFPAALAYPYLRGIVRGAGAERSNGRNKPS